MSFWTVILIFILFECSSVHIKLASNNFNFFKPGNFFKQIPNNSFDSLEHRTHELP